MGATIIDGMDTLYIMGMMTEYKRGREWIENSFDMDKMVRG
jgi:mannosyl-oligosaccharide alpha-1,2-mannosidase